MAMRKMDKDKDGKVSFEDFQVSVSIADICERDAFQVKEEPLLMEALGECLPQGKAGSEFRESVLDLPEKQLGYVGVKSFLQ